MTKRIMFAAVTLMVFAATPALAQCGSQQEAKCGSQDKVGCQHAKTTQVAVRACSSDGSACCKTGKGACTGDTNCAGDTVRYKGVALPRMAYQINDQRLTCPKSAAAMAKSESATIKYVVADKVYTEKTEALKARADVLDKFLDEMLIVKYAVGDECVGCPNAAQALAKKNGEKIGYRLASFSFEDRESAAKAAKLARETADEIEMKVMVGAEAFSCPTHAAKTAEERGEEVDFCVGKMKTTSEAVARIELALARIKAALNACEQYGGKQIAGV